VEISKGLKTMKIIDVIYAVVYGFLYLVIHEPYSQMNDAPAFDLHMWRLFGGTIFVLGIAGVLALRRGEWETMKPLMEVVILWLIMVAVLDIIWVLTVTASATYVRSISTTIVLLEGYLPIIYKFTRINPSAVWGAMFALARQGIAIVHTTNYKETVDFLYTAAKQEQIVEKRAPVVHAVKKVDTLADAQLYFIASLPNIGREKALAILTSYTTPMNALVNVDGWAKEVHGLGPVISRKVQKVLHTSFEE